MACGSNDFGHCNIPPFSKAKERELHLGFSGQTHTVLIKGGGMCVACGSGVGTCLRLLAAHLDIFLGSWFRHHGALRLGVLGKSSGILPSCMVLSSSPFDPPGSIPLSRFGWSSTGDDPVTVVLALCETSWKHRHGTGARAALRATTLRWWRHFLQLKVMMVFRVMPARCIPKQRC